jgi:hypothetical protein
MIKIMAICVALVLASTGALAQQKVYKWVDEDGVVHFSDSPPADSVEAETITTAPAPEAPAPTTPRSNRNSAAASPSSPDPATPPKAASPAPVPEDDISSMSLAELDQRCELARERKIAPLRETEIQQCKQDRRNDPNWCETFNADYGDGGRTASGAMRPRMFDDLPECLDAMNERNRRPR